jgi:hypothetical protein
MSWAIAGNAPAKTEYCKKPNQARILAQKAKEPVTAETCNFLQKPGENELETTSSQQGIRSQLVVRIEPIRSRHSKQQRWEGRTRELSGFHTTDRSTVRNSTGRVWTDATRAVVGGDGGNRTPVQNLLPDIYYTFSRCFSCSGSLPSTGSIRSEPDWLR